jgi:hypothetical protein
MAQCLAQRADTHVPHKAPAFKCTKCGSFGCTEPFCWGVNFTTDGHCMSCGAVGLHRPAKKDELPPVNQRKAQHKIINCT